MKLKAILTGATGMVGEGVLLQCLNDPNVEAVLTLTRRPAGISHPKLRELIVPDFFQLSNLQPHLTGYNACFFCLGVSSVGLTQQAYRHTTHDLTLSVATLLHRLNPDLTFCYVTGMGTDTTEQARQAWARVKGATENALLHLFQNAYMFRPGFMKATPGQKNLKRSYKLLAWIYPIGRTLYPSAFCTLHEVALAMIKAAVGGYPNRILEVKDIVALAKAEMK